jgi:hypothetical protein
MLKVHRFNYPALFLLICFLSLTSCKEQPEKQAAKFFCDCMKDSKPANRESRAALCRKKCAERFKLYSAWYHVGYKGAVDSFDQKTIDESFLFTEKLGKIFETNCDSAYNWKD